MSTTSSYLTGTGTKPCSSPPPPSPPSHRPLPPPTCPRPSAPAHLPPPACICPPARPRPPPTRPAYFYGTNATSVWAPRAERFLNRFRLNSSEQNTGLDPSSSGNVLYIEFCSYTKSPQLMHRSFTSLLKSTALIGRGELRTIAQYSTLIHRGYEAIKRLDSVLPKYHALREAGTGSGSRH